MSETTMNIHVTSDGNSFLHKKELHPPQEKKSWAQRQKSFQYVNSS